MHVVDTWTHRFTLSKDQNGVLVRKWSTSVDKHVMATFESLSHKNSLFDLSDGFLITPLVISSTDRISILTGISAILVPES